MKKTIAVTLIVAASFIGGIGKADAFSIGWNLIRVAACYGVQISNIDYLYIYPTTGGYLLTSDLATVIAAAQFCANGNAFYIYWDGAAWNGVVLYPGLK
jgi:hypothetical protein